MAEQTCDKVSVDETEVVCGPCVNQAQCAPVSPVPSVPLGSVVDVCNHFNDVKQTECAHNKAIEVQCLPSLTSVCSKWTANGVVECVWPNPNAQTLLERNSAMLLNPQMSDVQFVVGASDSGSGSALRIPAHKYVLATASTVFYAMFYGPLAEPKPEIVIPDVEPNAFVAMLKYLYCDHIQLESESVLSVLYCAKKYLLPQLSRSCVQFLQSNLTAQNAPLLLSQSRLFDDTPLVQQCLAVIDAQAQLALTSEAFTQIDHDTLKCILSRHTLKVKELTVFESAVRWAVAECDRRGLHSSAHNQRVVLGDALFLIRMATMELTEFANGPAQSAILTHKEVNHIFLHFTAVNRPTTRFVSEARVGLALLKCHRFLSSAYRSNQWRYRGRCDSIQFCVDKCIFLVGFGLYGSSSGTAEYKVKMELKRPDQGSLATTNTSFLSDGSSNTFAVLFENPIQIEADIFYIASVVLDGTELSYFGQDGLAEVVIEDTVHFRFQGSGESTNGTGVQGGQIPEILFHLPKTDV